MKRLFQNIVYLSFLLAAVAPAGLKAQTLQGQIPFLRAYDKSGINVFETKKKDSVPFDGVKVRIGAGFTQEFQNLKHKNRVGEFSNNGLYQISPGFNQAEANLYTDFLLADGIHLNVALYLSTRHHNETWVRGGYLQFDKLPFKGQGWADIMKYTTIKLGQFEVNYGDAHFRHHEIHHDQARAV